MMPIAQKAKQVKDVGPVQQRKRSRKSVGGFSLDDMCFLCGKTVIGSKDARKVETGREDFDKKNLTSNPGTRTR